MSYLRPGSGKLGSRRECPECGVGFRPPLRLEAVARFCSRPCANRACARSKGRRWGDEVRGSGGKAPYVKLNGRHEHRVVAERMLGRPLQPGEIVHHINGDTRDNRPENLEVLPDQGVHARMHLRRGRFAPVELPV